MVFGDSGWCRCWRLIYFSMSCFLSRLMFAVSALSLGLHSPLKLPGNISICSALSSFNRCTTMRTPLQYAFHPLSTLLRVSSSSNPIIHVKANTCWTIPGVTMLGEKFSIQSRPPRYRLPHWLFLCRWMAFHWARWLYTFRWGHCSLP